MATEYISREAAIKAVDFEITYLTAFNLATGEMTHPFEERNKGLMDGIEALKKVPAADVVEVVRGKWIDGKCDQCGEHAPYWCMASTYRTTNFCPNCGADMREDGTE